MLSKAEKKKLKKQAQAQTRVQERGGVWLTKEQWDAQHDPDIKLAALLKRIETIHMPDDVRLDTVLAAHPEWMDYLLSGHARVDKRHHPLLNRAIWYNELDKTHTFNSNIKRCNAADCVINRAVNEGGAVSHLLTTYHFAVREQRVDPHCFSVRDHFLKRWLQTPEDIIVPTRGEMAKWGRLQKAKADAVLKSGLFQMRDQAQADTNDSDEDSDTEESAHDTQMAELGEELGALSSGPQKRSSLEEQADYDAMAALQASYCTVMLNDAGHALEAYVASTDSPDQDAMDAILAPAMAASKEGALEADLKGLTIEDQ
ncbi:hypothetical protein LTR85_008607 [Meristemomyces frigidus]|nr:hypothetical protein LTR85_008607 [Meristemomyces frigidus]